MLFIIKANSLVHMMYIALYKVSIHTNILNVLCISTKSMKTVFTYSNRTFTDIAKLFPYDGTTTNYYNEAGLPDSAYKKTHA